jgi:hypothetical protein
MISTSGDQLDRRSRSGDVECGRDAKKGSQIAGILWAGDVVSGKNLQGDQMSCGRNPNQELWEQFDFVGFRHNLVLDSRGRKEQVDYRTGRLEGSPEPRCREAPHGILLDHRFELVTSTTHHSDERLRFGVVRDGNRNVGIPGEPWFGACRNRESADQCEGMRRRGEIGADST